MALVGITLSGTKTYESVKDPARGTPDATKFTIGTIDFTTMSRILDGALVFHQGDDARNQTHVRLNETNAELVRFGVLDWSNLKDANGNDIAPKRVKRLAAGKEVDALSDESLAVLGIELVAELAGEVRRANSVTKADVKN